MENETQIEKDDEALDLSKLKIGSITAIIDKEKVTGEDLDDIWLKLRNHPPHRKNSILLTLGMKAVEEAEKKIKDIKQHVANYLEDGGELEDYEMRPGYGAKKWSPTFQDKVASNIVEEWQFYDAKGAIRHLIVNNLLTPAAALKLFNENSELDITQYIDVEEGKPRLCKKKEV